MPTSHNSRIYPRLLPQLKKIHETSPSPRDKAQFPCIACSAIPCSQYNTKGALICLMEHQRVPKNNISRPEWHWCHQRNVKFFVKPKSIRDVPRLSCIGSSAIPHSPPTRQVASLTLGNYPDSLIYPSQIERNTNFSTGTRGKLHGCHIISRREQIPRILLNK